MKTRNLVLCGLALFLVAGVALALNVSFTVAVTDSSGPVVGALVVLDGAGGTFSATTDRNGEAVFASIPVGDYTLTCTVDDGDPNTEHEPYVEEITVSAERRGRHSIIVG